jgi:hypothetical protein
MNKREALEKLISIYHEVLLNEIAVMRANTIVEEGKDTGNAIIFYSAAYPFYTVVPNASRGLDYLVLAYSIVNGIRRLVCGYYITRPIDPASPERDCSADKLKEVLIEVLTHTFEPQEHSQSQKELYKLRIEDLIAIFVIKLLDVGLLFLVPSWAKDNLNTIAAYVDVKPKLNAALKAFEAAVNDAQRLHAFKLFLKLERFFEAYNISIDRLKTTFVDMLKKKGIDIDLNNTYFKTLHGMLFKYVSSARALPLNPATFEANILPFMLEPPLPKSYLHDPTKGRKLVEPEILQVVFSCVDKIAQDKKIDDKTKVDEVKDIIKRIIETLSSEFPKLSGYQYEYLLNMFKACSEGKNMLSVITSPTGSGKTLIFLLYTLIKVVILKLLGEEIKAIIIYPRKALARDQLERIIKVIYMVNNVLSSIKPNISIVIGIRDRDSIKAKEDVKVRPLRELQITINNERYLICHRVSRGKYSAYLAKDTCNNIVKELPWLMDLKYEAKDWGYMTKYNIIITNHSILYMLSNAALTNQSDETIKRIVTPLKIIVIDEAHVYASEDIDILASSFIKILYTRYTLSSQSLQPDVLYLVKDLDIIISSATLSDQQILDKGIGKLYSGNIVGFFKVRSLCKDNSLPHQLETFLGSLVSKAIIDVYRKQGALIYIDYDCVIGRDLGIYVTNEGDIAWKYPFKLRIATVINPYPQRRSSTALLEIVIALLHWLNAFRERLKVLDPRFEYATSFIYVIHIYIA